MKLSNMVYQTVWHNGHGWYALPGFYNTKAEAHAAGEAWHQSRGADAAEFHFEVWEMDRRVVWEEAI